MSQVLRRVEAGERLRVTVDGRPVADLVPIGQRRTFVPRGDVLQLLAWAPLDAAFADEIEDALSETVDEV